MQKAELWALQACFICITFQLLPWYFFVPAITDFLIEYHCIQSILIFLDLSKKQKTVYLQTLVKKDVRCSKPFQKNLNELFFDNKVGVNIHLNLVNLYDFRGILEKLSFLYTFFTNTLFYIWHLELTWRWSGPKLQKLTILSSLCPNSKCQVLSLKGWFVRNRTLNC